MDLADWMGVERNLTNEANECHDLSFRIYRDGIEYIYIHHLFPIIIN